MEGLWFSGSGYLILNAICKLKIAFSLKKNKLSHGVGRKNDSRYLPSFLPRNIQVFDC